MAQAWLDRYECDRDGELPPVCMKCGADAEHYIKRTFQWYPPWVLVMILVAIIVFIILAMVLTKKMTVYVPLCEEHKKYFSRRVRNGGLIMLAGFFAIVGGIALAVVLSENRMGDVAWIPGAGGPLLFLVSLIVGSIVMQMGIKPGEITDNDIKLNGVSAEFVDALKDQRRAKKLAREKRRAERDDDEEDRRPRRRRRDDDEYDD